MVSATVKIHLIADIESQADRPKVAFKSTTRLKRSRDIAFAKTRDGNC